MFGESLKGGAFAEYIAVPATVCARMPDAVDFSVMAAVPIAGLTALQAVVTGGKLKQGESVLINGSSGGVGRFHTDRESLWRTGDGRLLFLGMPSLSARSGPMR